MELRVGQVLNVKGNGIYGKLIGWRNGKIYGKEHNWTHSAIITEVKKDKVLIHEALTQGFVSKYHERKGIDERIKDGSFIVGDVKLKLKDVKKYADRYLGRGYGFRDIFYIIVYWISGMEAKFLLTGAKNLICSEAVSRILYDSSGKKVSFEKEFDIPFDLIEPMHLWQSGQIEWSN